MGRILIEYGDYEKGFVRNKVQARNKVLAGPFGLVCPFSPTTLGSPWPQITSAVAMLGSGPQTVAFTYSFVLAGTGMDPGTSVTLEDKFGGPGLALWKGEITSAINEWKTVFETVFSRRNGYPNNLTLTFTNLGDETGTSVASDPGEPLYTLPHADNIGYFRFAMHAFDGPGGTLAHAYSPETSPSFSSVGGDGHFDSGDRWRLDGVPDITRFSIKLVAVHELGHSFGLGHPSNTFDIMFAFASETQDFGTKYPDGLINGHTGGGSDGDGVESACSIEQIYAP